MKNSEFVTELKKAIEAAFKKNPSFEMRKIIFHEGEGPVRGKESENIEVYIRRNEDYDGLQYFMKVYVPEYQASAVIYLSETLREKIENAYVSSERRADIHKNLILTTVTA